MMYDGHYGIAILHHGVFIKLSNCSTMHMLMYSTAYSTLAATTLQATTLQAAAVSQGLVALLLLLSTLA
eukprot:3353-Heterococcus_DN1.PRE.6